MIVKKTPAEIDKMAAAGAILVDTLKLMEESVAEGVTTAELDAKAEEFIRSRGGVPAFKGYRGFPGSICASPNDMVVHGIPGPYKLQAGDIISVDVGVVREGWVADAARTFTVGPGRARSPASCWTPPRRRSSPPSSSAGRATASATSPTRSRTVVEAEGLSVVRSLVGHGIGRDMHEDPQIPNYGPAGRGPVLEEGMVLAVEPMVNAGRHPVRMGDDGWAIFSQDGSLAAHFEFTVAITADGPRVLTPWHES